MLKWEERGKIFQFDDQNDDLEKKEKNLIVIRFYQITNSYTCSCFFPEKLLVQEIKAQMRMRHFIKFVRGNIQKQSFSNHLMVS